MTPQRGLWLGATKALHRPAPIHEPYPHLCGIQLPSGWRIRRIDCGACGDQHHAQLTVAATRPVHHYQAGDGDNGCCPLPAGHPVHQLPDIDDDQRAAEARRTGDH